MKDYYRILGVDQNADLAQIKLAFRKKALQHHPDRGGTHADMVKINEAWEVLSNAQQRKQYDELLRNGVRDKGFFAAANERAQTYERSWEKFDSVLSAIGRDFANANYGSAKFLMFNMPTGEGSFTAWVFIIVGGLVGLSIGLCIAFPIASVKHENSFVKWKVLLVIAVGAAASGAWLAQMLHQNIRDTLKRSTVPGKPTAKTRASESTHKRTACPSCDQQLKLPPLGKQLSVTCPSCRHNFEFKT